jgi:putative endonuclease
VSTKSRLERGAASEELAAEYLKAQGLTLIGRNLRCKSGELDLLCLDGPVLVIVEVRQRSRMDFGGALASVSARKQRKIARAARFFLQRQPQWRDYPLRFDVLAVQGPAQEPQHIDWVKDAFRVT